MEKNKEKKVEVLEIAEEIKDMLVEKKVDMLDAMAILEMVKFNLWHGTIVMEDIENAIKNKKHKGDEE